jgi:hypothetical protein
MPTNPVVQIFVMRHGKKAGSEENAPLTDEGRKQIADAAEQHLVGQVITSIFSSTLDRARDTALIAYESAYCLDPHTGLLPVEQREDLGFVGLPLDEYSGAADKAKVLQLWSGVIRLSPRSSPWIGLSLSLVRLESSATTSKSSTSAAVWRGSSTPRSSSRASDPGQPPPPQVGKQRSTSTDGSRVSRRFFIQNLFPSPSGVFYYHLYPRNRSQNYATAEFCERSVIEDIR